MSSNRPVVPSVIKRSTYDHPLTGAQTLQMAASASSTGNGQSTTLSSPIHIQPRSSPRATASSSSHASAMVASSCPAFSWQPPAAPSARPRIASIDPPIMELPPSPPVFSPMQAEQVKGKKEESTSISLKKQIYSRSLSSSAPSHHIDYLAKFHPHFAALDEGSAGNQEGDGDESEEEQASVPTGYRPSARAMQAQQHHDEQGGVAIGNQNKLQQHQLQQRQQQDELNLSKSPTIFSILSTSAHQQMSGPLLGIGDKQQQFHQNQLNNNDNNNNNNNQLNQQQPLNEQPAEDDLQFSISLTDEQEQESEDQGNSNLPLY
jgi:hypothetical protein